jgi:hypothetical protein
VGRHAGRSGRRGAGRRVWVRAGGSPPGRRRSPAGTSDAAGVSRRRARWPGRPARRRTGTAAGGRPRPDQAGHAGIQSIEALARPLAPGPMTSSRWGRWPTDAITRPTARRAAGTRRPDVACPGAAGCPGEPGRSPRSGSARCGWPTPRPCGWTTALDRVQLRRLRRRRSTTSQDRWVASQARIALLRWTGNPSHSKVASPHQGTSGQAGLAGAPVVPTRC